jgi:translation initiation factor IF-2
VNNVVITRTTVVDVEHITVYRNVSARNAVVAVPPQRFARDPVAKARIAHVDVAGLRPPHGPPPATPALASGPPAGARGGSPPETIPKRQEPAARRRPAGWPGVSSDHDPPRGRALPLPPDAAQRDRAAAPPRPAPRLTEDEARDQAPLEVDRKPRGRNPEQAADVAPDRPAADAPRVRKPSTPPGAMKRDRAPVPPLSMTPDAAPGNEGRRRPEAAPVIGGPAREKPDRGDGPNGAKRGTVPDPPEVDRRGPAMTAPRPADLTGGPPVGSGGQISTRPGRPAGPGSAREPKVTRHAAPGTPTPVPLTREVKPRAGRPEPAGSRPPPAKPSPAVNRGKAAAEGPRKGPGPKSPNAEGPSR